MRGALARSSATTFDDLFGGLKDGFAGAADAVGEDKRSLCVGGKTVRISFAGSDCREALYPALSHLQVADDDGEPELEILVWESRRSSVSPPFPDWSKTLVDPKGIIREYSSLGNHAAYIWGVGAGQVFSRSEGTAIYWIEDAARIPYWERSFPFRQLLSWWLQPSALQPMHAACVAYDGQGVLMPGTSGSGKSTTSLLLGLSGYELLGDDYVLLDTTGAPAVWSLYCTAKLDDRSVELLPPLGVAARRFQPGDEKAVLLWPEVQGGAPMRRSAELSTVLLPKVTGEARTALRPASAGDVVLALAPTTINHLDVDAKKVLAMSQHIARSLPAYHLLLGADFRDSPELIRNVLRR